MRTRSFQHWHTSVSAWFDFITIVIIANYNLLFRLLGATFFVMTSTWMCFCFTNARVCNSIGHQLNTLGSDFFSCRFSQCRFGSLCELVFLFSLHCLQCLYRIWAGFIHKIKTIEITIIESNSLAMQPLFDYILYGRT